MHTRKNKLHSNIVNLPIRNSYLIQPKAYETGIIQSVTVQQLCIKASCLKSGILYHRLLSDITEFLNILFIYCHQYIYVLQRGPNTWKNVKFYTIFAYFHLPPAPRKQQSSHYFHTISLICQKAPHNSIYISRKLKSKLNSNFRFIWGKQTNKKKIKLGVCISVMTLCRPKEKWPPRIGSLNLFKNPKMFLTKMHYILHAALNKCQGHVAYHMLPPSK